MKFDFVFRPVLMLILLNCLITSIARAQDLEKLTPPTPEVASLLKDFNIPVGYYTGVPDISIPLGDVSIKGVSFPVRLSYNASGNRVEEIASFVGLGWNVSGTPFISRSILDKPDGQKPGVLQLYNGKTSSIPVLAMINMRILYCKCFAIRISYY